MRLLGGGTAVWKPAVLWMSKEQAKTEPPATAVLKKSRLVNAVALFLFIEPAQVALANTYGTKSRHILSLHLGSFPAVLPLPGAIPESLANLWLRHARGRRLKRY